MANTPATTGTPMATTPATTGAPAAPAATAPASEASQTLQNLLGLNTLFIQVMELNEHIKQLHASFEGVITLVKTPETQSKVVEAAGNVLSSGIKSVLSDEDYFKLVVTIFGDALQRFVKDALSDTKSQEIMKNLGIQIASDAAVKGAISEAVYQGMKRLAQDTDVQKALAEISVLIFNTQTMTNRINSGIETAAAKTREFLLSEQYNAKQQANMQYALTGTLASVQELVNTSIQETMLGLRETKFEISLTPKAAAAVAAPAAVKAAAPKK